MPLTNKTTANRIKLAYVPNMVKETGMLFFNTAIYIFCNEPFVQLQPINIVYLMRGEYLISAPFQWH
jgi:hypothetical protein